MPALLTVSLHSHLFAGCVAVGAAFGATARGAAWVCGCVRGGRVAGRRYPDRRYGLRWRCGWSVEACWRAVTVRRQARDRTRRMASTVYRTLSKNSERASAGYSFCGTSLK